MNPQQQAFLEHVSLLIPKLFEAIRLGNVKSEYVLGDRIIGQRQVRLKLVVEVVDPGSNPLATHSQMRQEQIPTHHSSTSSASHSKALQPNGSSHSPATSETKRAPRRGPRRKHPMSR